MSDAPLLRFLGSLTAALFAFAGAPAHACTATPVLAAEAGSVSPVAVNAGAVPPLRVSGGLSCAKGVIVLLGNNYLRARFASAGGLTLRRSDGVALVYTASADPNGAVRFAQNGTADYMQNNLLDVLGLLGADPALLPLFVRPTSGAAPLAGSYTDTITLDWDWSLCDGVGALGACVGKLNKGKATVTIAVTLDISAKAVVLSAATRTIWDPVARGGQPRALPGGRRRLTVSAFNPDLVPIDRNSVAVTVPLAAHEVVAFDGDGTGSPAVFTLEQGSPASGLTLGYAAPDSATDDVDFSDDGGVTWTYAPKRDDPTSQARVTHLRLRPQGSMAAGSRVTLSIPTMTR